MRTIGSAILVVWLLIGVGAAYQRNYFKSDSTVNCSKTSTVIVTIIAGPLNYVGANPKVTCKVPSPSK